jgi:hypothetical protein
MRPPSLPLFALSALALGLAACTMTPLPGPQATLDNIQAVRAADPAPMQIGAFTAAPGSPTQMDAAVTVRAGIQPAPEGSFAKYLGDTIGADLKAAGKLDPNAILVISGVVTDTHLDSGMPAGTAHAGLAAKFTLLKAGKPVFDKILSVDTVWDSNFIGAVAIPDAVDHYIGLFQALATKLFTDPDFVAASRAMP